MPVAIVKFSGFFSAESQYIWWVCVFYFRFYDLKRCYFKTLKCDFMSQFSSMFIDHFSYVHLLFVSAVHSVNQMNILSPMKQSCSHLLKSKYIVMFPW